VAKARVVDDEWARAPASPPKQAPTLEATPGPDQARPRPAAPPAARDERWAIRNLEPGDEQSPVQDVPPTPLPDVPPTPLQDVPPIPTPDDPPTATLDEPTATLDDQPSPTPDVPAIPAPDGQPAATGTAPVTDATQTQQAPGGPEQPTQPATATPGPGVTAPPGAGAISTPVATVTPVPPRSTATGTSAPPVSDDDLDRLQLVLDLVGLIEGLGTLADAANAAISYGRGDYPGAALSLAAAVPAVGGVVTVVKLVKRGPKVVRILKRTVPLRGLARADAMAVAKGIDDALEGGARQFNTHVFTRAQAEEIIRSKYHQLLDTSDLSLAELRELGIDRPGTVNWYDNHVVVHLPDGRTVRVFFEP
jgi:hypothetical protein